jgi:hypothetical protein
VLKKRSALLLPQCREEWREGEQVLLTWALGFVPSLAMELGLMRHHNVVYHIG